MYEILVQCLTVNLTLVQLILVLQLTSFGIYDPQLFVLQEGENINLVNYKLNFNILVKRNQKIHHEILIYV